MESKVKEVVEIIFKTSDYQIIERLMGGRSNYTYVVLVDKNKYTVRIPGKNGNLFVNRVDERSNLEQVNDLHINNETIYLDVDSGIKVSKYIEGHCLDNNEIDEYLKAVSRLLKVVHGSDKFKNDYNALERLAKFESFCSDMDYEQPEAYYKIKDKFLSMYHVINKDLLVPCHNDAQASNFIVSNSKQLYLTDWEFAGNNSFYYDIACFSEAGLANSFKLLDVYLDGNATSIDKFKVVLWRLFQTLQWSNVAMYKELIGLSAELEIDFKQVSLDYIDMANDLWEIGSELIEDQ